MNAICSHAQSENAAMSEALPGTFRIQDLKNTSKICQIVTIGKTCALDSTLIEGKKIEILNCEVSDGRNYMRAIVPISVLSRAATGTFAGKALKDWKYSLINAQEYRLLVCQRQNNQNRTRYLTGRVVITKLEPITFDVGTLIGQPLYLFSDSKVKAYVSSLENMIYNGFPADERSLVTMDSMALLNDIGTMDSQDMAGIEMIADNFTQTQALVLPNVQYHDEQPSKQASSMTSELLNKICQDLDFDHILSEIYKGEVMESLYANQDTPKELETQIVGERTDISLANETELGEHLLVIEQPQLEDLVPAAEETMSEHSFENIKDGDVEDESILGQQESDYMDAVDTIPQPEAYNVIMPSAETMLSKNQEKFGSNNFSTVDKNESSQAVLESSVEYRLPMPKFSSFLASETEETLTQMAREAHAANAEKEKDIVPNENANDPPVSFGTAHMNADFATFGETACKETIIPETGAEIYQLENTESRILESPPEDINMDTFEEEGQENISLVANAIKGVDQRNEESVEILDCVIDLPPAPQDAEDWDFVLLKHIKRRRTRVELDGAVLKRLPKVYCDHNIW